MKKQHAKIVVRTLANVKKEWQHAFKGQVKSVQKSDEIVFTSLDAVARVFSKTRMEILRTVINDKPKSIYQLAKMLGRDFKNVHSDVKLLADVGLIELKEVGNKRQGLTPTARFSGIDLDLVA